METQAYFDNIGWHRYYLMSGKVKRVHLLEKTLVAQDDLIVELEA